MESMSGVLRRLKIRALFIIASQLIKPSNFGSLWGGSVSLDYFFYNNTGIYHFYSISNIHNNKSKNLPNYTATPYN
jgi:hypothetical protein